MRLFVPILLSLLWVFGAAANVPPGLKYSGSWQLTNEVHYIYDGNLVVQERDANNVPLVTYTRGRDLSGTRQGAGGIGGLLARTDNRLLTIGDSGAHAYYHADGSGNVTALMLLR